MQLHPDKNKDASADAFQAVSAAWALLSDPQQRRLYDMTLISKHALLPLVGVGLKSAAIFRGYRATVSQGAYVRAFFGGQTPALARSGRRRAKWTWMTWSTTKSAIRTRCRAAAPDASSLRPRNWKPAVRWLAVRRARSLFAFYTRCVHLALRDALILFSLAALGWHSASTKTNERHALIPPLSYSFTLLVPYQRRSAGIQHLVISRAGSRIGHHPMPRGTCVLLP